MSALCDPNPARIAHHQRLLAQAGEPQAAVWRPGDFERRLRTDGIDEVVVTTVDAQHDASIVPALQAGCRVVPVGLTVVRVIADGGIVLGDAPARASRSTRRRSPPGPSPGNGPSLPARTSVRPTPVRGSCRRPA
ncbi:hypothetical protein ACFYZ3_22380 [Streptomyces sp. NPDC001599]|uniref:hypothetical protein n=1 Tax=Streptomyces sp. NPDC001599 TaxID=3364591 RepID=UPI0036BBC91D